MPTHSLRAAAFLALMRTLGFCFHSENHIKDCKYLYLYLYLLSLSIIVTLNLIFFKKKKTLSYCLYFITGNDFKCSMHLLKTIVSNCKYIEFKRIHDLCTFIMLLLCW